MEASPSAREVGTSRWIRGAPPKHMPTHMPDMRIPSWAPAVGRGGDWDVLKTQFLDQNVHGTIAALLRRPRCTPVGADGGMRRHRSGCADPSSARLEVPGSLDDNLLVDAEVGGGGKERVLRTVDGGMTNSHPRVITHIHQQAFAKPFHFRAAGLSQRWRIEAEKGAVVF